MSRMRVMRSAFFVLGMSAQELLVAKSATMQMETVSSTALRVFDTSLAGI
jgi:hypothetical protein